MMEKITCLKYLLLTITLVVLVEQICGIFRNRYQPECPGMYLRYSRQHTACRPANLQCKIYTRGINKRDRDLILRKHNTLRNLVALGYEGANRQPPAANMMQMVWDDELAAVAQKHADLCRFAHDCENCRSVDAFSVGQNIATKSRTGNTFPVVDWDTILQSFYDEVQDFSPGWISPFRAPKHPLTGHYSQMLWANSWKVGCGYTVHSYSADPRFQFVELYTCNYGPKGNIYGTDMYQIGRTCSKCPPNTCCGGQCEYYGSRTEYEGLCKPVDGIGPQPRPPSGNVFLWCNFRAGQPDSEWCAMAIDGAKRWATKKSGTGTYATIALLAGQWSTLQFLHEMDLPKQLCFQIEYRKGPERDGDFSNNKLSAVLHSTHTEAYYYLNFTSDASDWISSQLPINWFGGPGTMALIFAVPHGSPPQYVDIRELTMREGRCNRRMG